MVESPVTLQGLVLNQLQGQLSALNERVADLCVSLRRSLTEYRFAAADQSFEACKSMLLVHQAVTDLKRAIDQEPAKKPVFAVSSYLLHDAYRRLLAVKNESLLYACGNRYGHVHTIEQLISLSLERSELTYAKAEAGTTGQALIEIDRCGAVLTGHLHMHPAHGITGNLPSGVDDAQQSRLESGGHAAVGMIFTRDGLLRFYTKNLEFDLSITGRGVEYVDQNLYRLMQT